MIFHPLVHIATPIGVVNGSISAREPGVQKGRGRSLLKRIKSESAAIQVNDRVTHTRRRDSHASEKLGPDQFVEVARVLGRIVQMDFVQPMETLPGVKFPEIQGEGRLLVQRLKTAD